MREKLKVKALSKSTVLIQKQFDQESLNIPIVRSYRCQDVIAFMHFFLQFGKIDLRYPLAQINYVSVSTFWVNMSLC